MAKSLAQGQAKWERKTANAGDKWKAATNGAAGTWAAGVSESAGGPVGPMTRAAYEQGVGAVSAQDFNSSISGKGSKWAENYRRGISR